MFVCVDLDRAVKGDRDVVSLTLDNLDYLCLFEIHV